MEEWRVYCCLCGWESSVSRRHRPYPWTKDCPDCGEGAVVVLLLPGPYG